MIEDEIDPTSSGSDSRIRSIDILKGAAIIGVITAHIALVQNQGGISSGEYSIGELFYAALPMFFVIMGYFYKPGNSLLYNYRTRVLYLLLGFVAFTVILTLLMYGYLLLLGYDLSGTDLWGDILTMLIGKSCFKDISSIAFTGERILAVYEVTHQFYFLQIMIVGYVIFYPIVDHVISDWRKTFAAVIILGAISGIYIEAIGLQLPFLAQDGPIVAALMLIGAYMGKHNVTEYLETGYRERRYWILFAAFLILALVCIYLIPTKLSIIYSMFGEYGGWSTIPFLLISMSCGMVLFYLAAWVSKVPYVSGFLMYLGKECLWIFVFHMFVAKALIAPFIPLNTTDWIPIDSIWQGILLTVVTVAVILVFVEAAHYLSRKYVKC